MTVATAQQRPPPLHIPLPLVAPTKLQQEKLSTQPKYGRRSSSRRGLPSTSRSSPFRCSSKAESQVSLENICGMRHVACCNSFIFSAMPKKKTAETNCSWVCSLHIPYYLGNILWSAAGRSGRERERGGTVVACCCCIKRVNYNTQTLWLQGQLKKQKHFKDILVFFGEV